MPSNTAPTADQPIAVTWTFALSHSTSSPFHHRYFGLATWYNSFYYPRRRAGLMNNLPALYGIPDQRACAKRRSRRKTRERRSRDRRSLRWLRQPGSLVLQDLVVVVVANEHVPARRELAVAVDWQVG